MVEWTGSTGGCHRMPHMSRPRSCTFSGPRSSAGCAADSRQRQAASKSTHGPAQYCRKGTGGARCSTPPRRRGTHGRQPTRPNSPTHRLDAAGRAHKDVGALVLVLELLALLLDGQAAEEVAHAHVLQFPEQARHYWGTVSNTGRSANSCQQCHMLQRCPGAGLSAQTGPLDAAAPAIEA